MSRKWQPPDYQRVVKEGIAGNCDTTLLALYPLSFARHDLRKGVTGRNSACQVRQSGDAAAAQSVSESS